MGLLHRVRDKLAAYEAGRSLSGSAVRELNRLVIGYEGVCQGTFASSDMRGRIEAVALVAESHGSVDDAREWRRVLCEPPSARVGRALFPWVWTNKVLPGWIVVERALPGDAEVSKHRAVVEEARTCVCSILAAGAPLLRDTQWRFDPPALEDWILEGQRSFQLAAFVAFASWVMDREVPTQISFSGHLDGVAGVAAPEERDVKAAITDVAPFVTTLEHDGGEPLSLLCRVFPEASEAAWLLAVLADLRNERTFGGRCRWLIRSDTGDGVRALGHPGLGKATVARERRWIRALRWKRRAFAVVAAIVMMLAAGAAYVRRQLDDGALRARVDSALRSDRPVEALALVRQLDMEDFADSGRAERALLQGGQRAGVLSGVTSCHAGPWNGAASLLPVGCRLAERPDWNRLFLLDRDANVVGDYTYVSAGGVDVLSGQWAPSDRTVAVRAEAPPDAGAVLLLAPKPGRDHVLPATVPGGGRGAGLAWIDDELWLAGSDGVIRRVSESGSISLVEPPAPPAGFRLPHRAPPYAKAQVWLPDERVLVRSLVSEGCHARGDPACTPYYFLTDIPRDRHHPMDCAHIGSSFSPSGAIVCPSPAGRWLRYSFDRRSGEVTSTLMDLEPGEHERGPIGELQVIGHGLFYEYQSGIVWGPYGRVPSAPRDEEARRARGVQRIGDAWLLFGRRDEALVVHEYGRADRSWYASFAALAPRQHARSHDLWVMRLESPEVIVGRREVWRSGRGWRLEDEIAACHPTRSWCLTSTGEVVRLGDPWRYVSSAPQGERTFADLDRGLRGERSAGPIEHACGDAPRVECSVGADAVQACGSRLRLVGGAEVELPGPASFVACGPGAHVTVVLRTGEVLEVQSDHTLAERRGVRAAARFWDLIGVSRTGDRPVVAWHDSQPGERRVRTSSGESFEAPSGKMIRAAAVAAHADRLAVCLVPAPDLRGEEFNMVQVRSLAGDTVLFEQDRPCRDVALSADGLVLAIASDAAGIDLVELESRHERSLPWFVTRVGFDPLASAFLIRAWDGVYEWPLVVPRDQLEPRRSVDHSRALTTPRR